MPKRRRGYRAMVGQREPHLWLREFVTLPAISAAAGIFQGAPVFQVDSLDAGIDARRTIKRLFVKFLVQVSVAAANQMIRVFIALVVRRIGEASQSAAFDTVLSRQGDVMWSNAWAANVPSAAPTQLEGLVGHELNADIKAMRKLTVNDEIRLEVLADKGFGLPLVVGDLVNVNAVASSLIQRTRR